MANLDPKAMWQLRTTINRRRLLQGGAGLGLSLAGLSALSTPRGVSAQAQTALTFYHDKQPWQEFFQQMGDMAQQAIGINWEATPYADTTSYQAAVLAALPTDQAPDFFTWWSGYRIEDLYTQGVLDDVSDIWATAQTEGNLPESLAAAFTFDGRQYAIPSHVSYWVVFYNKKVFSDNGLTAPTTWEELTAAADALKGAGVTPFASTTTGRWPSFIWFEEMVLRTDPQFYLDLTAGRAKYTDPTTVKAMETWKGLIDKEYFTSFDTDMTNDWPGLFSSGQLAMIPIGTWYQSNFLTANMTPGEDYDLFIMPNVSGGTTEKVCIVETGALAIANRSQQVDAARQMANWWITPEAQTAWCQKLGDAPANPKATSDNPILANLLSTISGGYTLYQRYWEASPVPIVEGAVDYLAEFMLTGNAQQALENIQNLADSEWAKRGGPEGSPTAA